MTLPPPKGSIASIARVAGPEAAFRLAETRGGSRIFVPRRATPDCELAKLIGFEAAVAMSGEWPGVQIKVPVGREWRVMAYRDAGDSYDVIAAKVHIDRTTVEAILKGRKEKPVQLSLFADNTD